MPYTHSGEIGDVWKHLPLCEALRIERPARYLETNAAGALYALRDAPRTRYGICHFWEMAQLGAARTSVYLRVLGDVGFPASGRYFGSPALALAVLGEGAQYEFHDIEEEPLQDVRRFARRVGAEGMAATTQGDSIAAFLDPGCRLSPRDFVFIDPYRPLDANAAGQSFLDVFAKAYRCGAKTMLWYGYDSLAQREEIFERLAAVPREFAGGPVQAFDARQAGMTRDGCPVNPGVPGCGVAVANLLGASVDAVGECLDALAQAYAAAEYDGVPAALIAERFDF